MEKEEKPKRKPRLYFKNGEKEEKKTGRPERPKTGKIPEKPPRVISPKPEKGQEKPPKAAIPKTSKTLKTPPKARHRISVKDGKLELQKPKGREKAGGAYDFLSIKKHIEASLRKTKPRTVKSFGESRVATGIRGFDGVMQGGFLKNSVNMVAGGSGTGKSILCMQFLVNGIEKFNEPGVYISFEERPEKILRDMRNFNWNLEDKIKKKKLAILYYTPEQVEKVLTTGAGTVRDVVESIGAKRLVIDSITAFLLLHNRELDRRRALLKLFDIITKWGCTALLTSEHEQNPVQHKAGALEFEVDSVIILYYVQKGDMRQRAIEIFKMRATKHATKIFPMQITDNGIVVFPEESVF